MDKFHYLKVSLAVLLAVVGAKMMAHKWLKETLGENVHFYLLGVTVLILGAGVVASIVSNRRAAGRPRGGRDQLGSDGKDVVAGPIALASRPGPGVAAARPADPPAERRAY
jgi:hypothetical protein